MASRNVEVGVGVTVLAALALVIWSVTYLREVRLAESTHLWTARFIEVSGLAEDDPVTVNGVKKGSVRAIRLGHSEAYVDFILERDVELTSESRLYLRNVGMMGEKLLAITPGPPQAAAARLVAGRDTLLGEYEFGVPEAVSQMGDALIALEKLSNSVDRVLRQVEDRDRVKVTLDNVEAASRDLRTALRDSRDDLRAAAADLRAAAASGRRIAESSEPRIARTFDDVSRTQARFDSLLSRVDTLAATLGSVAAKADSGNSTVARLLNEQKLYDETRAAIRELTTLVREIRNDPGKFLKISVF